MNKLHYIQPNLKKFNNIDDLLKNNVDSYSYYFNNEKINLNDLLEYNYLCVVGEPGIGKSTLLRELEARVENNSYFITASALNADHIPKEFSCIIIDALDEVPVNHFFIKLQEINRIKEMYPQAKIIFSCRKHYIATFANQFSTNKDLSYIELCRLNSKDVEDAIYLCSAAIKESINKSPKLKELITIPRYLTFLLDFESETGDCTNVGDLFEYMINSAIKNAVENKDKENTSILIKRSLEKVALIMEMCGRDSILKDELYTILDGLKGNMAQMLLANFDLIFFQSRIMKETNGLLQFENTELQEYLAAKELSRQGNIESFIYDVAVNKELKHMYPNWFDVLPHISYSPEGVKTLISIIKLIIGYETFLENSSFESLLRYIDPTLFTLQDKEELFSLLLEHYLSVPSYIGWNSNIYHLINQCFTLSCSKKLTLPYQSLTYIQLQNILTILEAITEDKELDYEVREHWKNAADFFMSKADDEHKLIALGIYGIIKEKNSLTAISKKFKNFSECLKEKYCDVTSRNLLFDKDIIDCWLEACFFGNPHAIQAILNIKDLNFLTYAYDNIIKANKLDSFFNPRGSYIVFFDLLLPAQYELLQEGSENLKLIYLKVIAGYINHQSYHSDKCLQELIRKILLDKVIGEKFVKLINPRYILQSLLRGFDSELIDSALIHCVDELLQQCGFEDWMIEDILRNLTYRIYTDKNKKESINDYINRYSETFKKWEQNATILRQDRETTRLNKAYETLSNKEATAHEKYISSELLATHIDFLLTLPEIKPFIDTISAYLEGINLDTEGIKKTKSNSFSVTMQITKLPIFVLALYNLGQENILKRHKMILAKTLPIASLFQNSNSCDVKNVYKEIIGDLSDEQKKELNKWWKARNDDFINISHKDILICITDYRIDALSYKLEEYIHTYIRNPVLDNFSAAKDSLTLIAHGYCNWDLKQFEKLFDSLKDEDENYYGVNELKLDCNAIMIEKFQSKEAIKWRIEYLKTNIFKSVKNNSGHFRPVSEREIEVTSSNPYMFRCFMGISNNFYLNTQLNNLFEFGLSLSKTMETREYSNYLLRQICLFFINTGTIANLQLLRKKIYKICGEQVPFYVSSLMNEAELKFMNQRIVPVTKALHQYNKSLEQSYLEIRNDGDLCRYFDNIFYEVQREIQDVGIYSLFETKDINEDFIQRELKNTIINVGLKMGLELRLDREVTLQDNKRTDILLWHGMCSPILIEIKLLNNSEIQLDSKRKQYKKKFCQYIEATRPCMSVYWVFNVNKPNSIIAKYKKLETEYSTLPQTRVVFTDCKCSSKNEADRTKKQDPKIIKENKASNHKLNKLKTKT
ncbi:MAG: ATP-binding protein [Muribaculaceae bacterium]|nr:ATP-binding protein [Muribaculaceae bacterium]